MTEKETLRHLREIVDGIGNLPSWVRANALKKIKEMGYEYREDHRPNPTAEDVG